MPILEPNDLAPFADIDAAKAAAMIEDALALAARVAPCIDDAGFLYPEAAKAILRGAVLRWYDSGSGAFQQQTAGPFSVGMDTRQQRKAMFWPTEIEQLQALCRVVTTGAFMIDMTGLSSSENPLSGAVINSNLGTEPMGTWSEDRTVF